MRESPKQIRVLLADDHEFVRKGIRGLLSGKRKWRVVGEARDGTEAVEKARKLKPDIVILDIDMPKMNGLEATPRIREAVPHAKIVILTLHESGEMVRQALEAGARGLVLKSDLADRLITALIEISHNKLFLTPKVSEIVMQEFLQRDNASKQASAGDVKPSERETAVIRLLSEGKANKQIASELGISVRTAEAHRANVMKKLGLNSLAELIHYALQHGLSRAPQNGKARPFAAES
jgi:DNA-binding NarL/FixJ family response regulator